MEVNLATEEAIRNHLTDCSGNFVPPLAQRVDITSYARKIRERAITVEAWDGTTLAGLVAAYVDPIARTSFVTNVSVLPSWGRRGVATRLLAELIERVGLQGISQVDLEVSKDNAAAMSLYARSGFEVFADCGGLVMLRYTDRGERVGAHRCVVTGKGEPS